jgi:imidazole glycerol-phosphate synthase subunit HisH
MITIVDYGMGNLGSIRNMLKRVGAPNEVTGDPAAIARASKIILPGVGAFDAAMRCITDFGLLGVLNTKALEERVPILGVCLGMQLLTRGSEEGDLPGLGWIAGEARRFPAAPGVKVPHMGWNVAHPTAPSPLTRDLPKLPRFYFVHSYFVMCDDPAHVIMRSTHGLEFDSAVQRENIFGAQFHPEKSHRFGMQLLKNFAAL